MNKDHVDPLPQGNPTGLAQPVGAEERKKDENWRQLTESEKKEYAKNVLEDLKKCRKAIDEAITHEVVRKNAGLKMGYGLCDRGCSDLDDLTCSPITGEEVCSKCLKQDFIQDIMKLYKKYGLSIAHDSGAGAFIITDIDDRLVNWMKNAELED